MRVTAVLAGITAAAWALVALAGLDQQATVLAGFYPARASGYVTLPGAVPAFLTPLSATLVHAGPGHLVFNLIVLLITGRALEPVLGGGRLLALYVAGAYAAAAADWVVEPTSAVSGVGASGAVSALVAAYALLFGRQRVRHRDPRVARALGVLWLAAAWIVLQGLIEWYASAAAGPDVGTAAHVGGFLAGLALTPFLSRPSGPKHDFVPGRP